MQTKAMAKASRKHWRAMSPVTPLQGERGQLEPSVRVVIPAYNEAARIANTVRDFCTHFGGRAAVTVVANGCRDETADIVRSLQNQYENLALIDIAEPIGKGGAVRIGLKSGSETFVGYADADGSASASQLDKLLNHCASDDVDGVIGSRWIAGAQIKRRQPLKRVIASRAFNLIVRIVLGLPYTDTQCGAKVFRRDAIDRILADLELANFAFDIDLLFTLKRFGLRVIEVPIAWEDSPEGSKIDLVRCGFSMLLSIARLAARYGWLRRVPYSDLIGRGSVIPVKGSLYLFVVGSSASRLTWDAGLREVVEAWKSAGHIVKVMTVNGPLGAFRAISWYAKEGHREADAIVDLGSMLSWLTRLSAKPKLCLPSDLLEGDAITLRRLGFGPSSEADELARQILNRLFATSHLTARFHERNGGWYITFEGDADQNRRTISI
ncbi:MAG: dolichyl-phosphate beta-glucosyltransferase [Candidatus Baltobacteraceae bacterium]